MENLKSSRKNEDDHKIIFSRSKRGFLKLGFLGALGIVPGPKILKSQDEFPGKYSREAMYYTKKGDAAYCDLCPVLCIVRPGRYGDCKTRKNYNGKLYTIAYGNPCSVHIDPVEKKPLNHFLPGSEALSFSTTGCNFKCLNCQNWEISQAYPHEQKQYDFLPDRLIKHAEYYKTDSIAYTYTEPTIFYEYMIDTAVPAKKKGIKNLYISSGYICEKPLQELAPWLDAANIDLKSFDDEIYKKLNGGTLSPVLKTLEILKDKGVWLEITNLVIPKWTDNLKMIGKMCRWLASNGFSDYPLFFSRFHPAHKLTDIPPTPVKTLVKARSIAMDAGIKYVYIGNVPGSEAMHTYCPGCGKTLIERYGFDSKIVNMEKGNCASCGYKINGVWEK